MRKNVISKDQYGNVKIDQGAVEALSANGTYLPDVTKVVYNLKTTERKPVVDEKGNPDYMFAELDNPILTTKVWWADGTTTTVKNSPHDRVETEEVELEDGSKVKVATRCSKELGLCMATVKRTCGVPDRNGETPGTGFGKILKEIVDSAFDQTLEEAKAKIRRAKAVKGQDRKKTAKKRYSYGELARLVGPLLEAGYRILKEKYPEILKEDGTDTGA